MNIQIGTFFFQSWNFQVERFQPTPMAMWRWETSFIAPRGRERPLVGGPVTWRASGRPLPARNCHEGPRLFFFFPEMRNFFSLIFVSLVPAKKKKMKRFNSGRADEVIWWWRAAVNEENDGTAEKKGPHLGRFHFFFSGRALTLEMLCGALFFLGRPSLATWMLCFGPAPPSVSAGRRWLVPWRHVTIKRNLASSPLLSLSLSLHRYTNVFFPGNPSTCLGANERLQPSAFFFLPVQLNYEFEGPEMFIAEEYFSDYSLFSRHLNMFQMSRFSIEIWIFLTKKKT